VILNLLHYEIGIGIEMGTTINEWVINEKVA
jgi:hypothetical protein